MEPVRIVEIDRRGIIAVSGQDAADFLQGLVTTDIDRLKNAAAIHTALLSPQGKILFTFFVRRQDDGFLLETTDGQVSDLIKRLTMYRLRAKVTIEDVSSRYRVIAALGDGGLFDGGDKATERALAQDLDPRRPSMGLRTIVQVDKASTDHDDGDFDTIAAAKAAWPSLSGVPFAIADISAYHDQRIQAGIAEPGDDFELGQIFPHDINFDETASVDFHKGCFIGQEVVSRMKHKALLRRRLVPIRSQGGQLVTGTPITIGEATIGAAGSIASSGTQALAVLRLDRAVEAIDKGLPIKAGDANLAIDETSVTSYRTAAAQHDASR